MLSSVFPEHKWLPWKFKSGVPTNYWDVDANKKTFLTWLGGELNLAKISDWDLVPASTISASGGAGLIQVLLLLLLLFVVFVVGV